MFGYQHYKKRIEQEQGLSVIDIPADFNVTAIYTMALLNKSANALMAYLTQPVAENIFLAHGFMGLTTQIFDKNKN
ncbi:substrate-binding domain-containing protein [Providencia sp.]|uniref:substrate-binding domain-containing protein n=1 Tax=Providencia sp. TaxID=589 RepID=UPI003F967348